MCCFFSRRGAYVTLAKMSEEDEFLQKARAGFEDLCRALNMDEEASNEAWKTYENISRNFTLEVKIMNT